jgi:hypothetical protein
MMETPKSLSLEDMLRFRANQMERREVGAGPSTVELLRDAADLIRVLRKELVRG